ncbi:hypothetical protein BU17DRAFT_64412 [Hysterangium stoloniferum]|nr:hypothetical protein BU17DRAFT_64412 [Hysterangium stoloniferum]
MLLVTHFNNLFRIKLNPKGSSTKPEKHSRVQKLSKSASSLGSRPILLLSPYRKQCAELAAQQSGSTSNGTGSTHGSMPPPMELSVGNTSVTHVFNNVFVIDLLIFFELDACHSARIRSHPVSRNEGESFTNGSGAIAVAAIPTPEHLSLERKPSYKALTFLPEPLTVMAFGKVTSGNRADNCSPVHSNRAQAANADEEYDTASDHSHDDVAPSAATEVNRPADTPRTTLPPSIAVVALKNEVTEKMKSSYQVLTEGKASGRYTYIHFADLGHAATGCPFRSHCLQSIFTESHNTK